MLSYPGFIRRRPKEGGYAISIRKKIYLLFIGCIVMFSFIIIVCCIVSKQCSIHVGTVSEKPEKKQKYSDC